ncbi:MAG: GDP-L-fucose synthase [Desulfuromonadales bacterium]
MSDSFTSPSQRNFIPLHARIFVAGHRGMVGSAIVRRLQAEGHDNLLLRSSAELDLRNQAAVADFFASERPDYVFLAAARVGGIIANSTRKGEFIYDNLLIQANVIHNAFTTGVKRLLFLGSTCIYPKFAPQPMPEACLLTGPLEPTNDAYAVAKIAGISMCRSYNEQYGSRFLSAMPNNLYGSNDNFDLINSHVMPALIRKFYEAKMNGAESVTVWGSGTPLHEFMHVDDMADACLFLMNLDESTYTSILDDPSAPALINVGSGDEVSILELAVIIKEMFCFEGDLVFDLSKPDGTPRKLADVGKLRSLGWKNKIGLRQGVMETIEWFKQFI